MATALIDEHVRTYQTAVWWMNRGGGGGKAGPHWPLREKKNDLAHVNLQGAFISPPQIHKEPSHRL